MANYKSAYITKQPNSVNPSDWIAQQEQTNLYFNELKRKREQEEADKRQKQFEGDFDGEWDWSSSGDGTIDGFLAQMGMQAIEQLSKAKEDGEKALNTYGVNSKEYIQAKQRYDNLMSLPSQLKLSTSDIKATLAERQKMLESGNYLQSPSDTEKLDKFASQPLKFKFLPNGTALVNSGDITSGIADFGSSFKLGGLYEKIDENDIIQDIATKFKDKVIEDRKGYTTTKITNSWDNYKDPNTGKMVGGIKNALTKQYEDLVTDDYAKTALANRGVFDYDDWSDEQKDEAKATLINDMVEKSRPYIKEMIEEDFDTSARNQDIRTANQKNNNNETNGISFVESKQYGNDKSATANIYAFNKPYTIKSTNKSDKPKTLHQIRYDEQNGNIALIGREYGGKDYQKSLKDYQKALDEKNKAYEAFLNTEEGTEEYKKASVEYDKKSNAVDIAKKKTESSYNPDEWNDVTISNKSEVTSILSDILGVNSYKEIQERLKRSNNDNDNAAQDNATNDLPELDELPDLP